MISFSAASAVLRARATISSAWPRASASRSRYSARICSASVRVCSAASIDSSIARWRRSSASPMRGKATLLSTYAEIPKTSSVQIISPTLGETRKLPPESSAAMVTGRSSIGGLQEEGDQTRHQAVEEARLGEREAEPLDARDLVAHLGLPGDGLDDLAEDDADADAGADGTQAATHAEGDRPPGVRARVRLGEDGGDQGEKQIEHCGLLWLSGTRRPRRRGKI